MRGTEPSDVSPAERPGDAVHADDTVGDLDTVLLGGPRTLSTRDLAERAGIDVDAVRTYWRTMGLPHADPDDAVYTEADAEAIDRAVALTREHGLDDHTVMTVTRSLGHTSDRLALWQVEALVEDMATRYELDDVTARLLVLDRLADLAPVLEAQLVHSYRRQLAAIAGRYAAEFGELREPGADRTALPLARAVGFADMVSFTRRTAGLGSWDLSVFVQRFETAARDVISAGGGRVVKTIGDAVLFVADDAPTGASIALDLAATLGGDETGAPAAASAGSGPAAPVTAPTVHDLPRRGDQDAPALAPVRVGFVWGRVLSRFGDVFGPHVNLAARLTDIAEPSAVYTDPATARVLADDPRFGLEELVSRDLEGIGPIAPVRLRRAGA